MNDSDTEFVDYPLFEGRVSQKDIKHSTQDNTVKSSLISINLPIKAVVTQLLPDDDSEDDKSLFNITKTKEQVSWKCMKKFTEELLTESALTEKGSINFDIPSPFKVFNKCFGLQGLLPMLKIESDRYLPKMVENEISDENFSAFLDINILVAVHNLQSIKIYWEVDEGHFSIHWVKKTMKRSQFMEILKNIYFTDDL